MANLTKAVHTPNDCPLHIRENSEERSMIGFKELATMQRGRLLLTTFLVLSEGFAQKSLSLPPVTIGIYLLVPCGSKSASKQRIRVDTHFRFPGEGCMERTPIIDQNDVQSAELLNVDHPPAVGLTLYPAAAQRILSATKENIGGHMAVVVNGRIVGVPMIAAPLRRAVIQGDLTQAQANNIFETLNRKGR